MAVNSHFREEIPFEGDIFEYIRQNKIKTLNCHISRSGKSSQLSQGVIVFLHYPHVAVVPVET